MIVGIGQLIGTLNLVTEGLAIDGDGLITANSCKRRGECQDSALPLQGSDVRGMCCVDARIQALSNAVQRVSRYRGVTVIRAVEGNRPNLADANSFVGNRPIQ